MLSSIINIENHQAIQSVFADDEVLYLFKRVTLLGFNMKYYDGHHEISLLLNAYPKSPPKKWLLEKNANNTVLLFRFGSLKSVFLEGKFYRLTAELFIEADSNNTYVLSIGDDTNSMKITHENKIRVANIYPIYH